MAVLVQRPDLLEHVTSAAGVELFHHAIPTAAELPHVRVQSPELEKTLRAEKTTQTTVRALTANARQMVFPPPLEPSITLKLDKGDPFLSTRGAACSYRLSADGCMELVVAGVSKELVARSVAKAWAVVRSQTACKKTAYVHMPSQQAAITQYALANRVVVELPLLLEDPEAGVDRERQGAGNHGLAVSPERRLKAWALFRFGGSEADVAGVLEHLAGLASDATVVECSAAALRELVHSLHLKLYPRSGLPLTATTKHCRIEASEHEGVVSLRISPRAGHIPCSDVAEDVLHLRFRVAMAMECTKNSSRTNPEVITDWALKGYRPRKKRPTGAPAAGAAPPTHTTPAARGCASRPTPAST